MLNDLYQTLDPIAFSIGPFSARWYGIAYALGFLLAAVVIYFVGKRWKMRFDFENICVVIICAMVGVIIGGRLGYVLVYNGSFYAAHPLEVLNFANGGMSFHGGLVGALLAGIVAAKIIKMPYLSLLDVAIIGVPIGLFFGRCANFVNGELWGAPTDLPWGVVFGGSAGMVPRHPSQLYERCSSSSCSRCRSRSRPFRAELTSAPFWWAMASSASWSSSFASLMRRSATCLEIGLRWGNFFRFRSLWRGRLCLYMPV